MKLIEINLADIPKCKVLAYSNDGEKIIGHLFGNKVTGATCFNETKSLSDITHYLPLDDIKPESERVRTYFAFLSMYSSRNGVETFSSKTTVLKRLNNELLQPMISEFMLKSRESFAVDRNVDINSVLVTSFGCTETT